MHRLTKEPILGHSVSVEPTMACIRKISRWLESRDKARVLICANPHSIVTAETDSFFREAIQAADLVTPDGVGIVLASKILGGRIQERVTGSDIFYGLSDILNSQSNSRYSYYFIGSTIETLNAVMNKMAKDYPNITFAGAYSPPFKTEFSEEDNRMMIEAINRVHPDVLWVGMTAPKQEKWIYQNKERLNVKFIGAIGAVFDFYAGNVKRSQPIFHKVGLEWLPRLIQEPRRLWRRNFVSNPKFMLKVLAYKFSSKRINIQRNRREEAKALMKEQKF